MRSLIMAIGIQTLFLCIVHSGHNKHANHHGKTRSAQLYDSHDPLPSDENENKLEKIKQLKNKLRKNLKLFKKYKAYKKALKVAKSNNDLSIIGYIYINSNKRCHKTKRSALLHGPSTAIWTGISIISPIFSPIAALEAAISAYQIRNYRGFKELKEKTEEILRNSFNKIDYATIKWMSDRPKAYVHLIKIVRKNGYTTFYYQTKDDLHRAIKEAYAKN